MSKKGFLWETFKLKLAITFSKKIPPRYKIPLKLRLINKFELPNISLTKGLFRSLMTEDSYDIFTSSILSLNYSNVLSLHILTRAQIEMFLFTRWLAKNPSEIKNVFNDTLYGKDNNLNNFYKKNEKDKLVLYFWNLYNQFYSQKAHPLPKRFLTSIYFLRYMKPKKKDIDISQIMDKSFNKLPEEDRKKILGDTFEIAGYAPSASVTPHSKSDPQLINFLIPQMIYLYDETSNNLKSIEKICPNHKMSDKEWERAIAKYQQTRLK